MIEPGIDAALVPSDVDQRNFLVVLQSGPGGNSLTDVERMLGSTEAASYDAAA